MISSYVLTRSIYALKPFIHHCDINLFKACLCEVIQPLVQNSAEANTSLFQVLFCLYFLIIFIATIGSF